MLWWTLRKLRSKHDWKRVRAADKLGELKDDRAVQPLVARLKDDRDVRRAAARALGMIGDRSAVEPLVAALADVDSRARKEAAIALRSLGWRPSNASQQALLAFASQQWDEVTDPGAVPPHVLIASLNGADHSETLAAARLLGLTGDPQAARALLHLIISRGRYAVDHRNTEIIQAAAAAAIKNMKEAAIPPLLEALTDPAARERARSLLTVISPRWPKTDAAREAVPSLIDLLKASHSGQRRASIEILGKIGDPRAAVPVAAALKDADENVRNAAAAAMLQFGHAAVAPLIKALKDAEERVSYQAAVALGKIADSRAVEPLVAVLTGSNVRAAEHAAVTLGEIGDARAAEPLIAALESGDARVAEKAACALGQIGGATAAAALEEVLQQNRPGHVVAAAVLALGKTMKADAIKPLSAALKSPDASVRKAAAEALGMIRDTSAVSFLVRALADRQREVCGAVARALKAIDDQWASSQEARDALPKIIAAGAQIADEEAIRMVAEAIVAIDPNCMKSAAASRMNKRLAAAVAERQRMIERQQRESEAARLAAAVKNAKTIEPLIEALGCDDWQVRKAAVEAMASLRDPDSIEPLSQALADDSIAVQIAAVETLTKIGGPRIVRPLLVATKSNAIAESVNVILRQLLESMAKDISERDLKAIAALENLRWQYRDSVCVWNEAKGWKEPEFFDVKKEVDYSQLRQLARQELIRRGIEA